MPKRQKPRRLAGQGERAVPYNRPLPMQERGNGSDQERGQMHLPPSAVRRGTPRGFFKVNRHYRPAMKRQRSSSDESVCDDHVSDGYEGDTESLNGSLYTFSPLIRRPRMRYAVFSHSDAEDNEPLVKKVAGNMDGSSDEKRRGNTPSSPDEDERGNRIPKFSAMEAEAVLRQELGIPDPVVAKKQAALDCLPSDDEPELGQGELAKQGPSGQPPLAKPSKESE